MVVLCEFPSGMYFSIAAYSFNLFSDLMLKSANRSCPQAYQYSELSNLASSAIYTYTCPYNP